MSLTLSGFQQGVKGVLFQNVRNSALKDHFARVENVVRIQGRDLIFCMTSAPPPSSVLMKGLLAMPRPCSADKVPSKFHGQFHKFQSDLFDHRPMLGIPHVHDEGGVQVAVADVPEGGDREKPCRSPIS